MMSAISNLPISAKHSRMARKEITMRLYPKLSEYGQKGDRERDYGQMMMLVFTMRVCCFVNGPKGASY
jgi:hypothetical protein